MESMKGFLTFKAGPRSRCEKDLAPGAAFSDVAPALWLWRHRADFKSGLGLILRLPSSPTSNDLLCKF